MQCYAQKNVPRGEEFCTSNFNATLRDEFEPLMECYESIPLYTMNYCSLKYKRDPVLKLDCFLNKAKAILDQKYCDDEHPIVEGLDGVTIFNNRYACYREIQLEGFNKKDIAFCEYVNLYNTTAKYQCIDALSATNAGDDATEFCVVNLDGGSGRKESKVCTVIKKDDLLSESNETNFKGADYC